MGLQSLGGYPQAFRLSIDTTGRDQPLRALTEHVRVVAGSNTLRVFFTKEDFDADVNYVEVTTTLPLSLPIEVKNLWFKASAGTIATELVAIYRKG
jgi:hypothetical protein